MTTLESKQQVRLKGEERRDGTVILTAQHPPGCLDAALAQAQALAWELVKAGTLLALGWILGRMG